MKDPERTHEKRERSTKTKTGRGETTTTAGKVEDVGHEEQHGLETASSFLFLVERNGT